MLRWCLQVGGGASLAGPAAISGLVWVSFISVCDSLGRKTWGGGHEGHNQYTRPSETSSGRRAAKAPAALNAFKPLGPDAHARKPGAGK